MEKADDERERLAQVIINNFKAKNLISIDEQETVSYYIDDNAFCKKSSAIFSTPSPKPMLIFNLPYKTSQTHSVWVLSQATSKLSPNICPNEILFARTTGKLNTHHLPSLSRNLWSNRPRKLFGNLIKPCGRK